MGCIGLIGGSGEMKAVPVKFEIMDGPMHVGNVELFDECLAVVEILEPCHGIESWQDFSAQVVESMRAMGLET